MMWKKQILAMAAATFALTTGGIAHAGDDGVHERGAKATIDVPRNADGSIDGQSFVHEVDSLVAGGVRAIRIRDASFSHEEARSLLIPLEGNLIGEFANRLPKDNVERQITLQGDVDVRVQRMANGELHASIKDLVVVNPTEARRAEYALLLAEKYGLDRLTVRAIDAGGNHLRVEYRAGQGIVRNESRADNFQGGEDHANHRKGHRKEDHAGRHEERKGEMKLDVPRHADGTIDGQSLVNEVDSLVARGVRVISIRDSSFTHEEARSLLIPLEGNLIGEMAARLPNDGIQRQITLRGDVDVRVQRQRNGELRASIKDLVVVNPTEARRAEYTQLLAEKYGLDRLSVHAIDAEGNRLRVEYRADQGIVRNESRPGHPQVGGGENHAERGKHKNRGEHHAKRDGHRGHSKHHAHHGRDRNWDRAERGDGEDRDERHARFERKERNDHAERGDGKDRNEQHARFERKERSERAERGDGKDRNERHARFERKERNERAERGDGNDRVERHARLERKERNERPEWRDNGRDRVERHARFERKERAERPERHAKFERTERAERPERRVERMERPERHVKFERPERRERIERAERPERATRPERVERPERSGRD